MKRAQPETPSTFLRRECRTEFLLHSRIRSFCVLQTLETLSRLPLVLRGVQVSAPGAVLEHC